MLTFAGAEFQGFKKPLQLINQHDLVHWRNQLVQAQAIISVQVTRLERVSPHLASQYGGLPARLRPV